jgi:hypothetical protein
MSLVNDALKRAKDAQQKSTPPAPQLRPPDPVRAEKRGAGTTMPLVIAALAVIVAFFFVWRNQHQAAAKEVLVETKPALPANALPETRPAVQPVVVSTPTPVPPVVVTPAPAPAASTPAPPLKLQAIFFAPGRSTAIISGKTVRVGNTFKEYRVAAITETSATLVSATETNVMTLEQ